MFLDDLPSATVIGDYTYYDTHIPLGYVRWRERPTTKATEELDEDGNPKTDEETEEEKPKVSFWQNFRPAAMMPHVYIYNHLDIEVTIHETAASQVLPTTIHE